MKIIFEKLTFKNVLSYGNKPTIFIFKNGIDLVIGSNGNGKSTFVDALTYVLFGKPFRKIKIGSLINNKNNKELLVEVEFSVNGNRFRVKRGQKPDIFEIYKDDNGEWVQVEKPSTNRDYQKYLEENILLFGENVFRQLIALGANLSSSKNFMDLSKSEKEEVLQVITDTTIFNKIKEKVKEKKLTQKTQQTEYEYKVDMVKSTLDSIKFNISAMEKQNTEFSENRDKMVGQMKEEISSLEDQKSKYLLALDALDELEKKINRIDGELNPIKEEEEILRQKEFDLKSKAKRIIANEKNKIVCPNCEYEIKEELPFTVDEVRGELKSVSDKLGLVTERIVNKEKERLAYEEKLRNKTRIKQNFKEIEDKIKNIEENIEKTLSVEVVEIDYSELKRVEKEFEEVKNRLIEIKSEMSDLVDLETVVSDKNLKGVILNQQLPFLNKYINEFLELFDSKFNFVIDASFNEKIISRNSDNDFNSLSNGQKQRISLSILFAFLKLIEEKNGISTNLLILDEYLDSSLDIDGIDEVMSILDEVFSPKKDVVLISHNQDIKNRLELLNRVISVETEDGFSQMKEINDSWG